MLCRKQNATPGVKAEAAQAGTDATGQAQLARRIQKEQEPLAHAVTLSASPNSNPLRDGQIFTGDGTANGALHVKRDGHSFDRLAPAGGSARDACNRAGEYGSGGSGKLIEAERPQTGHVRSERRAIWLNGWKGNLTRLSELGAEIAVESGTFGWTRLAV